MKNSIQIFAFDSHAIRVVGTPEEPLFVAPDIAKALEYRDAFNALRILDEDEKGTHFMSTPGGEQEMTVITESGLYSLILRSNKPEAKTFKRWVTHEVLPSIRKTGMYASAQKIEQLQQENEQWQKNLHYYKKAVIELYREKLFKGDMDAFYEAQWIWRLRQQYGSFSKIAEHIGWTPSKVSSRYKKYVHYLDATRLNRYKLAYYNTDEASLHQIYEWVEDIYTTYLAFIQALTNNDERLHHLGGRAVQESKKLQS